MPATHDGLPAPSEFRDDIGLNGDPFALQGGQLRDQHPDSDSQIGRPRQLYTGPVQRAYVDVEKRG